MVPMFTWTKENTETLVRMKAEGYTPNETALALGVTERAAYAKADRMGLPGKWAKKPPVWSDEVIATLTRMSEGGYSPAEIARTIGKTRKAVIGKIWRLGLADPARAAASRSLVGKVSAKAIKPIRQDTVSEELKEVRVVDESLMRPWTERQFGQCAFPIVRGEVTYSCCADVKGHKSYCPEHQRIMYQPSQAAKPRPAHIKTDGRHLP